MHKYFEKLAYLVEKLPLSTYLTMQSIHFTEMNKKNWEIYASIQTYLDLWLNNRNFFGNFQAILKSSFVPLINLLICSHAKPI